MDSSPPISLTWQFHPARHRPGAAILTAGVISLAGWICADLMGEPGWGLFAGVVLIVGSNRFFFPTTYELDDEGITARFPLKTSRIRWPEARRFVFDSAGGFLSPRARRSLLDEYRGVSLLFPVDSENIIQEIRRRLPAVTIVQELPSSAGRQKERTSCGG